MNSRPGIALFHREESAAVTPYLYGKGQTTMVDGRSRRDTYRYHFKVGNRIVHRGITRNLEQREEQHQRRWGGGRIVKIGRMVTWDTALAWERAGGRQI